MSKVDGLFVLSSLKTSFAYRVNRCKVVHAPVGIEAFVPESTVRERYAKIDRTYSHIRSALASDCNEYLPFYRLHDDLMVEIWIYLSVLDRHHVAQVSQRFRSVALNTPRLWAFIDFISLPSVLRSDTFLKRAGPAPLHIRVNNHGMPPPPFYGYPLPRPPVPFLPPPPNVIASVQRAAVIDAMLFRKEPPPPGPPFLQAGPKLKLDDLRIPAPLLRSLRLSMLPVVHVATYHDNIEHASTQVTEPLFGGNTPLLRHLALIQCNITWSDPVFRNLTYLLIRKPDTPIDISRLVQVLRTSPNLTYLGLETTIAPAEPDKMPLSAELPALQRLYITDKDTQRIIATLRRISAPNLLECDLTSADSAWFEEPITACSPFSRLHATQEMTLTVTEHHTYRCTTEYRWGATHAVRLHLDPTVMNHYVTTWRGYEDQTAKLINILRLSPILFERIRSLTLRGCFSDTNLMHVLPLFPAIERLSTRHLTSPRNHGVGKGIAISDILSVAFCRQLRAIDIGAWPEISPSKLLTWVSARAGGEGGCCKLNEVIVTSEKPLPSKARSSIVPMLERFLWRKSTVPKPSHYGPSLYYPPGWHPPPVIPTSVPSPISEITTSKFVEPGSWDEDAEWARVPSPPDPIPPFPPNLNPSVLDDPTLIYCDRALQGRWDYFAIPGM